VDSDPCAPVAAGALSFVRHGGQVLEWTPAGTAVSRLWLSPGYACGPGKAVRGGVPVIFPQFAGRGALPKHGFARDRAWRCEPGPDRVTFRLGDDEATRALWPHRFELTLRARAFRAALDLELEVRNSGEDGFSFTAALHSYLTVGPDGAWVHGLAGLGAEDNAAGGARLSVPAEPLAALQPRDLAVRHAPGPVRLDDPVLGPLAISATGFTDVVVWNPGPGHGLADVPDGGERGFVCVEPALLEPERLAPGQIWRGAQRLSVGSHCAG
jgi:glucose-6-phosphate 1-epimerase